MTPAACRFCGAPIETVFADLGMSPLANSYLPPERANAMEPFYPLRALVCEQCLLVQLQQFETPEAIFSTTRTSRRTRRRGWSTRAATSTR